MDPNFPFYFLGHFKPGGWWYYFPVNLFLKMSAASILLLILGILYSFNKNELKFDNKLIEKDCCIILLLLAPATLFLTATSIKALPLGSRYIIPCLPFIYCVCGYSFSYALNKKNFLLISLLSILISLHVYRTISIFPDEMAYFNEFIGDAGDGFLYVNDSSVDAGQNLPRLASFLRERGNPPVKILYQGQDRPGMYGIKTNVVTQSDWDIAPSPGIYAISANWLIYGQKETLDRPNVHKNWLTTYKPIKKLGGSIWIYEFQ
jgi:hypothetical protein